MPTYRVTLSVKLHDPCRVKDLVDHVAEAVACWGGQYHEDDELSPTNFVQVQAVCRGVVAVKR